MLSTHGGVRAPDGTPIALGYHTGHWEVGLLVEARADVFKAAGAIPFAAACTDPCDGRSQGTTAMFDSLPFRNDAATVFRRLIRSLPTRRGVLGVATCDKGLPAMMMALAGEPGSAVRAGAGRRHAARRATVKTRARCRRSACDSRTARSTLEEAADLGCRACGIAGWRLPVSGHGGDLAGRGRSAWPVARPLQRLLRPGSRSGSTWPGDRPQALMADGGARHHDARRADRRGSPQRDGDASRRSADRRTCSCTFPPSRTPAGLRRPTAATGPR